MATYQPVSRLNSLNAVHYMATPDKKPRKRNGPPSKDTASHRELELIENCEYGNPKLRDALWPPLSEEEQKADDEKWAKMHDAAYGAACAWLNAMPLQITSPTHAFDIWSSTMDAADRELDALRRGDFASCHDDDRRFRLVTLRPLGSRVVILDIIATYVGRVLDWHFADAPLTFTSDGPVILRPITDAVSVNVTGTAKAKTVFSGPNVQDPWPVERDKSAAKGTPDATLADEFVRWCFLQAKKGPDFDFGFAEIVLRKLEGDPTQTLADMERDRPLNLTALFRAAHAAFLKQEFRNGFHTRVLSKWKASTPPVHPSEMQKLRGRLVMFIEKHGEDRANAWAIADDLLVPRTGMGPGRGKLDRKTTGIWLGNHLQSLLPDHQTMGDTDLVSSLKNNFGIELTASVIKKYLGRRT